MQFFRGMRDKLGKYFDEEKEIEINMEMSGRAVYDFCCFGIDEKNQLSDERYMIFYNQVQSPNNEIVYSGMNNTCKFLIHLEKLPSNIQKFELW